MRSPLPRVSRRGRVTIAVLAVVLVLLALADRFVDLWTDWLWFGEVGYRDVFGGVLRARLLLFFVFGIGMAVFIGGNLYLAYRLRPLLRANSVEQHALERYRLLITPRIGTWIGVIAGLIGFFTGLSGQAHWEQWILFRNAQPFGSNDPEFGVDVGFYIFKYPFWRYLLDIGFTATVLAVIGALAVHYLYGGVRLQGVGDRMTAAARAHLTSLIALFVALKAVAYFLDRRALLLGHNSGTDTWGAGYTAINAVLPAKEILAYISIVVAIAIVVFSNAGMRNLVWAGVSLGLLAIAAVAIGGIYPAAVQQFTVKPNIRDKEADYIARTIAGTRQAYGIGGDQLLRRNYPANTLNPPASLATDKTIVPTIRLLDPAVVPETFSQFQLIRPFYAFNEKLDVDRYTINNQLQDYVVAAREIDYSKLVDQQRNWQNRHTVYTHGYGFVAAPANRVDTSCGGSPFFVSGLVGESQQCASATDLIKVSQPRIYYGELAGDQDYAIVGKASASQPDPEFDRPSGDSQQLFTYDGKGGVPITSMGRRLLYALHFREGNFLLSDVFNDNSKLIYVRDPVKRVEKVAPFLTLDGDPYPAVINGRVIWIIDAYTTSATYPYSQRVSLREAASDSLSGTGTTVQASESVNYIRNSVKATVDAYDGTVTLYQFDESDPILKAWNQAFGGDLIKPRSAIPPELADHFRYPEDLFKVQRDLISKFHVDDPKQFNSQQDFWQVPDDPARHGASNDKQPPYYLLTQFPDEPSLRFQLTSALSPRSNANLAALLTGSYGTDGRPVLELLELSRDNRIPGVGQARQAMENDGNVRDRLTLLSGGQNAAVAAQLVYGNLLSLPYGGGMLYVQPVYIRSANATNPFPLMKLVLVSYGGNVGFGESLNDAIKSLLKSPTSGGGQTGNNPPPDQTGNNPPLTAELNAVAQRMDAAIQKMQTAMANKDFTAYGQALSDLQQAVDDWKRLQGTSGTPSTTPSATPSATPGG